MNAFAARAMLRGCAVEIDFKRAMIHALVGSDERAGESLPPPGRSDADGQQICFEPQHEADDEGAVDDGRADGGARLDGVRDDAVGEHRVERRDHPGHEAQALPRRTIECADDGGCRVFM